MAMNARRLQEERGWSQTDLARISGLSVSTVRKMSHARHSAQVGTLQRLAAALEVADPDDLLTAYDPLTDPSGDATAGDQATREPVTAARAAFNQQVEELKRVAARVARADAAHGERMYAQLTGRVRQMTSAAQAERRRAG